MPQIISVSFEYYELDIVIEKSFCLPKLLSQNTYSGKCFGRKINANHTRGKQLFLLQNAGIFTASLSFNINSSIIIYI